MFYPVCTTLRERKLKPGRNSPLRSFNTSSTATILTIDCHTPMRQRSTISINGSSFRLLGRGSILDRVCLVPVA